MKAKWSPRYQRPAKVCYALYVRFDIEPEKGWMPADEFFLSLYGVRNYAKKKGLEALSLHGLTYRFPGFPAVYRFVKYATQAEDAK